MNAAMLMLVASTMTAPQPAATNDVVVAPSSFTMGHNATFVTQNSDDSEFFQAAKPAAGAQKAAGSPTHQMAGKTVTFFIQGGIVFCCSHTGFGVGGQLAFVPMKDHKQFEVNADFNFIHLANTNGFYLTFNGQYNFIMAGHNFNPFAGGGLTIGSFNYNSKVALDLFGGIQTNLASGRAIRFQLRVILGSYVTNVLLFGFAF